MRRSFARSVVALLALAACQAPGVPEPAAGQIEHIVLIWMKDPNDAVMKQRLIDTSRSLPRQIGGIVALSIGEALPSDREVVDDSFDLALVMRFVDRQALAAYGVHPVHQQAVAEVLMPAVARFVVHDVVVR